MRKIGTVTYYSINAMIRWNEQFRMRNRYMRAFHAHRIIGDCPYFPVAATVAIFVAASLISAHTASACATCFGDPDSGQTVALNWAMGAMLGVTAAVMAGIGAFAYGVYRRGAAEGAAPETAHE